MKYQVLPELTPIEYEALKSDIAQRGVLVPIDVDEKGEILDGHHRVRAWNELQEGGIEVPSAVLTKLFCNKASIFSGTMPLIAKLLC